MSEAITRTLTSYFTQLSEKQEPVATVLTGLEDTFPEAADSPDEEVHSRPAHIPGLADLQAGSCDCAEQCG